MKAVTIQRTAENGAEEKEIYLLEDIDSSKYRLLGKATGVNMSHCVLLGMKHNKNFWHGVYGFQIIKNEELEKVLGEAMKEFNPNVEPYITVCFYERLAEQQIMNIPKRLNILERPELNNFPLNIMFSTVCLTDEDEQTIESSVYDPDLSTYEQNEDEQYMKYYNNLSDDRRYLVEITYDTANKTWRGTKYFGDKVMGIAIGSKWDVFFTHLTSLGVKTDINS